MKRLIDLTIVLLLALVIVGCASKEPEVRVVEKVTVEVITPPASLVKIVPTPMIDQDYATLSKSEALDALIVYVIQLQTVVQSYEANIVGLHKWIDDTIKKHKDIKENNE